VSPVGSITVEVTGVGGAGVDVDELLQPAIARIATIPIGAIRENFIANRLPFKTAS